MRTWEDRMAGAALAFNQSAEAFEQDFVQRIGITKEMGVEHLDDDEVLKFGDFREAFKSMPIATLRIAFKSLRESKAQSETVPAGDSRMEQLKALGLKVRLEDADPATLLPLYDAAKPNDPVTTALKKRFAAKPVIAFHDDGSVAVEESLRNIADMEQGFPEADAIQVDGKLARLWPIGVRPNALVEEDPLFPGLPLRNGCSTVNHRNWAKVPHWNRVFCRIVVERGEIDVNNRDAVLRLIERATFEASGELPVAPVPHPALSEAYPEAYLEYNERSSKDTLPKLKVELGNLAKPNNPFGVRRQY